jgi:hypothetical protein
MHVLDVIYNSFEHVNIKLSWYTDLHTQICIHTKNTNKTKHLIDFAYTRKENVN